MKTLLRIDSSLRQYGSHTRALGDYFQALWLARHPEGVVKIRDLAAQPVPHLTASTLAAFGSAPGQAEDAALSDTLIGELCQADQILICAPLYNFGLPSPLKAWLDHVVRAGHTFVESPDTVGGYRGLLAIESACIICARGGTAATGEGDPALECLASALRFIGVSHVTMVSAPGMAAEEAHRTCELARAMRALDAYVGGKNSYGPHWEGDFSTLEREEIQRLSQSQANVISRGDVRAYAALCAPNVRWLFPGHDLIIGREAFIQAQQALRPRFTVTAMRKYPITIERAGEMAIEIGRQEIEREGVTSMLLQKYTHVVRKTPEGWRYVLLMSNSSE